MTSSFWWPGFLSFSPFKGHFIDILWSTLALTKKLPQRHRNHKLHFLFIWKSLLLTWLSLVQNLGKATSKCCIILWVATATVDAVYYFFYCQFFAHIFATKACEIKWESSFVRYWKGQMSYSICRLSIQIDTKILCYLCTATLSKLGGWNFECSRDSWRRWF